MVWVHAGTTAGFPKGAKLVQRGSWAYHWHLARAQFWVDDQGFPRQFRKPAGTTYVQTWHGTPLKRMGFDSPALEAAGARERAAHQAMIDRWDCLLAPSEYFVDTFARSYRYRGPVLRSGSPRNDPLVAVDDRRRGGARQARDPARPTRSCCTRRRSATVTCG